MSARARNALIAAAVLLAGAAGLWLFGRHMLLAAAVKLKLSRSRFPAAYLVPAPLPPAAARGQPLAWGRLSLASPWGAPTAARGNDKAFLWELPGGRKLAVVSAAPADQYGLGAASPERRAAAEALIGASSGLAFERALLRATPDQIPLLGPAKKTTGLAVLCLLKAVVVHGDTSDIKSFEAPRAEGFIHRIPSKDLARVVAFEKGGPVHELLVGGAATDEELAALAASLSFN